MHFRKKCRQRCSQKHTSKSARCLVTCHLAGVENRLARSWNTSSRHCLIWRRRARLCALTMRAVGRLRGMSQGHLSHRPCRLAVALRSAARSRYAESNPRRLPMVFCGNKAMNATGPARSSSMSADAKPRAADWARLCPSTAADLSGRKCFSRLQKYDCKT